MAISIILGILLGLWVGAERAILWALLVDLFRGSDQ